MEADPSGEEETEFFDVYQCHISVATGKHDAQLGHDREKLGCLD